MMVIGDRIPDEGLKEIFPKKLSRPQSSDKIYIQVRKMILSGQLEKGQKLLQEKLAEDFRVRRVTIAIVFSKLKKDRLIISKRGVGSFVV